MEKDIYRQFYEFERDHWWSRGMRYLCKRMLSRYIAKGKDCLMLDLGCGTGELARELEAFGDVVGADLSEDAIDFCRKRRLRRLVRTEALNAGFKDNTFAAIVAFCLIEHIEKDTDFLREANRILKKGGRLIMVTSAFNFLWSSHDDMAHHKRRYTTGEIKKKVESSGFSAEKVSYINSFLFPAVFFIRAIQKIFDVGPMDLENGFVLDIVKLPRFANELLYGVLVVEAKMLDYIKFPAGVGIICIAKK